MAYKTILVHVDDSRHVDTRIRAAAKIATAEAAHLIGVATIGVARFIYQTLALNTEDVSAATHLETLRQQADNALARFETISQQLGVASFEKRLVNEELARGICLQARYCDLVVLGQSDPYEALPGVLSDFPERVVMNCRTPVLVIPYAYRGDNIGNRVLVAWNGSEEATQAVHHAIPLLQRAASVHVAMFDPESPLEIHGESSAADIGRYLGRHMIHADVLQQKAVSDTGKELLLLASELECDVLVMGCYGHSRFREILLGGVTRTVLESTTIPLLMSH